MYITPVDTRDLCQILSVYSLSPSLSLSVPLSLSPFLVPSLPLHFSFPSSLSLLPSLFPPLQGKNKIKKSNFNLMTPPSKPRLKEF